MNLKNLSIQDFRSFNRFELKNLGRVNLLVGTNNSGKTTVLEAINILMADGDFSAMWSALSRRGEEIFVERDSARSGSFNRQVDIRRLFRGHEIGVDREFQLSANTDAGIVAITARIEEYHTGQRLLFNTEPSSDSAEDFSLLSSCR